MEWKAINIDDAGVLVVWPGTVMTEGDLDGPTGFRSWIQAELADGMRLDVTIVGCVKTLPTCNADGIPIKNTGDSSHFFFCVKGPGVGIFARRRFEHGMRWWEDIYFNGQEHMYPADFLAAYPDPNNHGD